MLFNVIKDKSLTIWSILFVIIIFILQLVLVYRLYQTKIDLIQREVELVFNEAYSINLGKRIEYMRIQQQNAGEHVTREQSRESTIDSLKNSILSKKGIKASVFHDENYLSFIDVIVEEEVSIQYPIKLKDLDVIVDLLLKRHDLILPYNIVLFNPINKKIISQTNQHFEQSSTLLSTRSIPLNIEGSESLVIYFNPNFLTLYNWGWVLILSFIFSVFCIYCLYYQLSALLKQKELSKSKNSFFSEVSHELVRPLSVIHQALDSLRNDANIYDPVKREKYISFAQIEIDKMSKKIDMVLSLARDDEGMFELNIQQFDLVKLVYDEVDSILVTPPKQVDFDIDNQLKSNPNVFADKDHIEQVLSNLIGNSIKYSDQYLTITIKLYRDKKNVYISVKDTGVGISKEMQQFIFDKYSRADESHSKKGYGIGLNYVKRVVAKHGGDISLSSELKKGSEFIIRLPQRNSDK